MSVAQRFVLDSLAFQQDCAISALLAPQKKALDSIKARFRAEMHQIFTPDQLQKLDERNKDIKARREAEQAKEPKRTCSST